VTSFSRVFTVGDVPSGYLPAGLPPARPLVAGHLGVPERVPVEWALERLDPVDSRVDAAVVLTDRDLHVSECGSVIGFASRSHRVVMVSLSRLRDPDSALVARRVANAVAHEAGHLEGLRHCATPTCLMHQAESAHDIDRRSEHRCGQCPRTSRWASLRGVAAALVVLAVVVSTADYVAGRLMPGPEIPFTCTPINAFGQALVPGQGPEAQARVEYDGRELFSLRDFGAGTSLLERSRPAIGELNRLWRHDDAVRLRLDGAGERIRLLANETPLLDVLPRDVVAGDAAATGLAWAERIAEVFRRRGRTVEVIR
jgi:hypothetical protein